MTQWRHLAEGRKLHFSEDGGETTKTYIINKRYSAPNLGLMVNVKNADDPLDKFDFIGKTKVNDNWILL
jgi:hypothetical protein